MVKYFKVSVGDSVYNLTKYNRREITDTTNIKAGMWAKYFLQTWCIKQRDENVSGKLKKIMRSTRTSWLTVDIGAPSITPIGDSFLYNETNGENSGDGNNFDSFDGIDNIQNIEVFFIITDFQTQLVFSGQRVDIAFDYYHQTVNDLQNFYLIKILPTVLPRHNGLF